MSLSFGDSNLHWNYYLAIEEDLKRLSRYIEFNNDNEDVYSIELSHILLSASSEVEVVLRSLCLMIDSTKDYWGIDSIGKCITTKYPSLINEEILISRYNLKYKPFVNWNPCNQSPYWWSAYNNVKHHRYRCFYESSLKNAINAVGALYISNLYYYQKHFSTLDGSKNLLPMKDSNRRLGEPAFIKSSNEDYYYSSLIC